MIKFFKTRLGLLAGMTMAITLTAGAMISLASTANADHPAEPAAPVAAER